MRCFSASRNFAEIFGCYWTFWRRFWDILVIFIPVLGKHLERISKIIFMEKNENHGMSEQRDVPLYRNMNMSE